MSFELAQLISIGISLASRCLMASPGNVLSDIGYSRLTHRNHKVKEIMASGDRLYVYQVGRRVIGLTPTLLKAFR